jgi:hypothetical protein
MKNEFIDTLFTHTHNSELQAVQRYRYSTHFPLDPFARTRILSLH